MKRLIIIALAILAALPAAAQQVADTTSTVVGEKLDFDTPNFLARDYFEAVKAHLSAEGRKNWKAEFSIRGNLMIYHGSTDLTVGIRTSPNKVFGLGAGWGSTFVDANPAHVYDMEFFLFHRHYFPLDRGRRFSFYSDLLGGGQYSYKVTGDIRDGYPRTGVWGWWIIWQPGFSIRLWGKSNIFFGPSLCLPLTLSSYNIGVHAGIAL